MSDLQTLAAKLQERRQLSGWKEAEPRPPEKKDVTLIDVWRGFRKMVFGRLVLFYFFLAGLFFWLLVAISGWFRQ